MDLAKQVLKKVAENTRRAIEIRAVYTCCAENSEVIEPFNKTWEAHGFQIVRSALLIDLILVLMRIYDAPAPNTASLQTLAKLLSDNETRAALPEHFTADELSRPVGYLTDDEALLKGLKDWHRERATEGAQRRTADVTAQLDRIRMLKGDHRLQALRLLRHKTLAHTAVQNKRVTHAKYGYAEALLDQTIELVNALSGALLATDYAFDELGVIWAEYAGAFWKKAASGEGQGINWYQTPIYGGAQKP